MHWVFISFHEKDSCRASPLLLQKSVKFGAKKSFHAENSSVSEKKSFCVRVCFYACLCSHNLVVNVAFSSVFVKI